MRGRVSWGACLLIGALALSGCGIVPPIGGPDRSESVPSLGGTCEIGWWLAPAVENPPAEAERIAADALQEATVSDRQWDDWYRLLDDDPDLDTVPAIRLRGSAYLEAVREDVRTALEEAGYPDDQRVVEVHANLSCAKG
ncbi:MULTISPECIES: hypothetical protein [Microbacterium]|uniref:hypothetical protein n=1 Tax=Microbacterium TaxID=33882 RepID=UPI0021A761F5|nr:MULTISPECIES: hypothetical protein [Microbacterium]MCT1366132.1 hypothetical protein [Microbacterium sp. p3-SID131]MCT1375706.1 hypothetical protein [Microbacterium sp. p3-SID337]MCZ0710774.1 hypothetical protein [Microbacterium paraoxydans]MDH5131629.1 hypothetical protein [Microbacterium sp. RD10]MDH5135092.1 hypothetical protein [Microbacterium sp. RD11]